MAKKSSKQRIGLKDTNVQVDIALSHLEAEQAKEDVYYGFMIYAKG